ncbi:MAG: hypothetical protein IJ554_00070 [Paludibacteraceae bacterium]|nr:hypothetical protein [Paludibacteraceae bacterium]
MTQKHIIILVGGVLAVLWLGLVYFVLRAPQYTEKTITVSPSPHYATPVQPIVPLRTHSHLQTTHIVSPQQPSIPLIQPHSSSSTMISPAAPFTYLHSSAQQESYGTGVGSNGSQMTGNSSSGQRGIVYAGSSHSWIGFVSPVASRDMAYVESSAGSLPDRSYLSGVRKAPPEEGGGGTNGPNIENEQPIGDGILFLLIAVVIYTIAIFFEHKKRKNKKL